jgi:DNA-binding beta-propeller fold protein YncE
MIPAKSRMIGMLTVCIAVAACIGTASADWVSATVATGSFPDAAAVNPVTNKIYVCDEFDDDVTVIDGATNATLP